MLALLMIDAVITYSVALGYANRVHDADLADDAVTLTTMIKTHSEHGKISPQARFLLQFDPDGRDYFSVRSSRRGLISGSTRLGAINRRILPGQGPRLYDMMLGRKRLRLASMAILNPRDAGDILQVTVGESVRGRRQVARQILWLSIPLELGLTAALLLLVWLGVRFGLRVFAPLTQRLARREHDLSAIDDSDVPKELLPLIDTINALFARLRDMMQLQERFIADAAHQLRTPLSGLRLQVERAVQHARDPQALEALHHIEQLTARVSRTSTQLLALTRAQMRPTDAAHLTPMELSAILSEQVGLRVPEAIAAGIDLGLELPRDPVWTIGDSTALQEALDNLIDNSLRHTPRGGTVTVSLVVLSRDTVCIQVDDDGSGVATAWLPRLGERFFRAPESDDEGTGLGLAIVQRIVQTHAGSLAFEHSALGGLSVQIRLRRYMPDISDSDNVTGAARP